MRLFTGLSVGIEAAEQLAGIIDRLRPAADLRWSPVANLHVTTAFIGNWSGARLGELKTALGEVARPGPISIQVTGLGYFPNPHHAHSLFLAVRPDPALTAMVESTNDALKKVGGVVEEREYHPHITLARIARENITQLRVDSASMHTLFPLPAFSAAAFHLYESCPAPGGSVYNVLATFPLAESAKGGSAK